MEKRLTVSAREIDLPRWADETIRQRTARLERLYPRLVGCSVAVQGPGQRHRNGGLFSVQLELRVPNADPIVVSRQKAQDLQVAIREAFDAASRQIEDFARKQRGAVKRHEPVSRGRIVRLFPREGHGFISSHEARPREIYFKESSLLGASFDQLEVGEEVRFHEEQGDEGPQASTVEVS